MWRTIIVLFSLMLSGSPVWAAGYSYEQARAMLIDEIEQDVRETSAYINKTELDERVMQAIATVPRHEFVPPEQRRSAYENRPLAIGHGQTISQPYIVALMTDLINLQPGHRVLEIGTGSGYQAAILAQLTDAVYSIEIIEPLGKAAKALFQRLGYDNITTRIGDGYYGWEEHAPFDSIIVTAAASHVPPPLIQQLKPGGIMVIPVGSRFLTQQLMLITKDENGEISSRQVLPVAFVPLTGGR